MDQQKKVCETLENLKISYELTNHTAVYTIEEMEALGLSGIEDVCKNLFLRDAKGKRHFLVVMQKDKKADLKALRLQLGCTPLSFASEERLMKYLGLTKGAVTPLGVLNDSNADVEVVFDSDLKGKYRLGIHPNVNTATVWISFEDLKKVVENNGNDIIYITIPAI